MGTMTGFYGNYMKKLLKPFNKVLINIVLEICLVLKPTVGFRWLLECYIFILPDGILTCS